MEYVLRTNGLTKRYSGRAVVEDVNMTIRKGDIYGFIGRNGAGKTTLMRMILSMADPTSGSYEIFEGMSRREAGKKIGSLIEAPGLYKSATAYENMKRFGILTDSTDEEIKEILQFVGLGDTGKKQVKNFSLGMRQRLGIAIAMLGNPEFLVLDEPVNGLDPAGMKEVRELIMKLNQERGMTVLISSHLLEELSKMATVYGIINNGRLVEEITPEQLEARCQQKLIIGVDKIDEAIALIKNQVPDINLEVIDGFIYIDGHMNQSGLFNKLLVENGLLVYRLEIFSESIENYFVQRIGG